MAGGVFIVEISGDGHLLLFLTPYVSFSEKRIADELEHWRSNLDLPKRRFDIRVAQRTSPGRHNSEKKETDTTRRRSREIKRKGELSSVKDGSLTIKRQYNSRESKLFPTSTE